MFSITEGRGFRITFDNGWAVSVQFGPGHYADHYDMPFGSSVECGKRGARTAETAVLSPRGELVEVAWEPGDTVQARQSPAAVLRLLNWAAKQPAGGA